MARWLAALLILAFAPLAEPSRATAATLDNATLPDSYSVDGHSLALNGIGLRTLTIFSVRIYVAGLYLSQPSHDAAQILASPGPKVVLLHFLHAGTKAQIEREYRDGERTNCGQGGCATTDQADFERLVAAAPAVKPGDTSTFIFTAQGTRVLANDRVIASFNNPDLARRLLGGFIGNKPPSQSLRNHLLGIVTD